MKRTLLGALVAASLGMGLEQAVTFTPALAQSSLTDRDGVRADRGSRHEISRREAIHMAKFSGVTRVRNVDRRGRYWIACAKLAPLFRYGCRRKHNIRQLSSNAPWSRSRPR
jgi:hypothetical protein